MRFEKGQMPPVKGFWSLTMYDPEFFFVPNPIDRYSLSQRDTFVTNEDGSVDLYLQAESPGPDKEANWLPAPEGKFIPMLRLYWPEDTPPSILDGSWTPPPVRARAVTGFWLLPWLRGIKAYVYGFPMVMMDLTKEAATAATVGEITAPPNQFSVMTHYPDASFRAVARTGLDTLFAMAWADLDEEPLVLSVPDTGGRYYVFGLFDMWSNVFASIGKRTTGTAAANFLIAGPGWKGTPPGRRRGDVPIPDPLRVGERADAGGRAAGCAAVTALQRQYKLTPAQRLGHPLEPAGRGSGAPGVDTTPPLERVQKMDAGAFFGRLARLMKDNPPAPADAKMLKTLRSLGIEPGKEFDIAAVDRHTAKGLQRAMGTFGHPAEGPQEAEDRERLDRDPGQLRRLRHRLQDPRRHRPDRARWHLAARRRLSHRVQGRRRQAPRRRQPLRPAFRRWPDAAREGDLVGVDVRPAGLLRAERDRPLQRGPVDAARYNDDGSLDIYIQAASPGEKKESNWLPAPASGPFNLTVRIYWPTDAVLDGTYKLPPVRKVP